MKSNSLTPPDASAAIHLARTEPAAVRGGVSLVIPAYNEAGAIAEVVQEATAALLDCGTPFEVIVVDDHSADGTGDLARQAGARVVRHPYNRGYGNSLKSGIQASRYEYVVFCDADGSYPLNQLPRLLEDADQFDMVVGAREGKHFHGSIFKRLARTCQLRLVSFVTGMKVPDANSGFRLIGRESAMRFFDFVCTGFSFTTSITIGMLCEQYLVKFVKVDYRKRTGSSHVRYVRDTLRSLQIIVQCALRYNPLKMFVLCALLPLLAAPLALALALANPLAAVGALVCVCASVLVFALGMLAYCVRGQSSPALPVSSGVYSSARVEEPDKKAA